MDLISPPSQADAAQMQREIGIIDMAMERLKERIETQTRELNTSNEHYQTLQSLRDSRTASLTQWTILRLPAEVLAEIIYLDIESSDTPWRNLSLERVNRAWRNIVLNSPRMWTSVFLPANASGERWAAVMAGLATYIYRSKALPLKMYFIRRSGTLSRTDAQKIFTSMPAKQRWKHVTLTEDFVQDFIDAAKEDTFKQLQSFEIQQYFEGADKPEQIELSLILAKLPPLSQLSLDVRRSIDVGNSQNHLSQLKHLSLNASVALCDIVDFLRQCPKLEDFSMASAKGFSDSEIKRNKPKSSVLCPKLRHFCLGNTDLLVALLDLLRAPALQQLSISFQEFKNPKFIPKCSGSQIMTFLRQSRTSSSNDSKLCQLHTLELLYVPLTSDSFVDILGELPCLKELKLKTSPSNRRNYFDDEILQILQKEYEERRRLPRFHTLIVDVPSGAVTRSAFLEFVASQANLKLACLGYVGNNDREARAPHFFARSLERQHSELCGRRNVDLRLPALSFPKKFIKFGH